MPALLALLALAAAAPGAAVPAAPDLPALRGAPAVAGDRDAAAVIRLERRLWEAWRRGDGATVRALSDPHYVNVTEESVDGLSGILADLPHFHLDSYRLGPMAPLRVGRDAILLNYRAEIIGHYDGRAGPIDLSRPVSESSLWVRRAGAWRNLMLHETTVAPVRFPHAPTLAPTS
jgi:hypothetical protein